VRAEQTRAPSSIFTHAADDGGKKEKRRGMAKKSFSCGAKCIGGAKKKNASAYLGEEEVETGARWLADDPGESWFVCRAERGLKIRGSERGGRGVQICLSSSNLNMDMGKGGRRWRRGLSSLSAPRRRRRKPLISPFCEIGPARAPSSSLGRRRGRRRRRRPLLQRRRRRRERRGGGVSPLMSSSSSSSSRVV